MDFNSAKPQVEDWKARHSFARAFYACIQSEMIEHWDKLTGKKELRPSLWTEFVESSGLWEMAWQKFRTLSHVTVDMFEAEMPGNGMEAVTQERELYVLVPLQHAAVMVDTTKGVLEAIMTEGRQRYACQQLLKIVLAYFFADVYQKEFTVMVDVTTPFTMDRNTISKPFFLKVKA